MVHVRGNRHSRTPLASRAARRPRQPAAGLRAAGGGAGSRAGLLPPRADPGGVRSDHGFPGPDGFRLRHRFHRPVRRPAAVLLPPVLPGFAQPVRLAAGAVADRVLGLQGLRDRALLPGAGPLRGDGTRCGDDRHQGVSGPVCLLPGVCGAGDRAGLPVERAGLRLAGRGGRLPRPGLVCAKRAADPDRQRRRLDPGGGDHLRAAHAAAAAAAEPRALFLHPAARPPQPPAAGRGRSCAARRRAKLRTGAAERRPSRCRV